MTEPSNKPRFFLNEKGVAYVEIQLPADQNTVIRKVRPDDAARYPREWQAFSGSVGGNVIIATQAEGEAE